MEENKYEYVDHPNHYNNYDQEVIEMIRKIWGPFITSMWCEINAFKYRMRMGTKPNNSIEQDIKKENVYLEYYNKFKEEWQNKKFSYDNLSSIEKDYLKTLSGMVKAENKSKKENILTD